MNSSRSYSTEVVGSIGTLIFCAMMIGGLLGSLLRSRRGEEVSRGTFLSDSVRFFEPLGAIYLVFYLPVALSFLLSHAPAPPWVRQVTDATYVMLAPALLPLLYAPVAVVARNLGFAGAVAESLRAWRSAMWPTVTLIAVGAFLHTLSMAPAYLVPTVVYKTNSWLSVPLSLVLSPIAVAVHALITLAVWEFYQANVLEPENAPQERG